MSARESNQTIRKAIGTATGSKLPKDVHVDHITPRSQGGTDSPDNLQLLSRKAHEVKTAIENVTRPLKRVRKRK